MKRIFWRVRGSSKEMKVMKNKTQIWQTRTSNDMISTYINRVKNLTGIELRPNLIITLTKKLNFIDLKNL